MVGLVNGHVKKIHGHNFWKEDLWDQDTFDQELLDTHMWNQDMLAQDFAQDFFDLPSIQPLAEEQDMFSPCPISHGKATLDARDVSLLYIKGGKNQQVQIHLFGTKDSSITLDARGDRPNNFMFPMIQETGDVLLITAPPEGVITYNIHLPRTMNVRISGGNVLVKEQNMTKASHISVNANQEYSVRVLHHHDAQDKHAYVCRDLSCAYKDSSYFSDNSSSYVHKILDHPETYRFRGSQ